MTEARLKAVFYFDTPAINKLKGCALFWKKTVVYEGFMQELVQYQEPTEFVSALLKNDILKVAQTPEGLKNALHDKTFYGLDKKLWQYLYENAEKVAIAPELPQNIDEIIAESSKLDYADKELKQLYDSIIYQRILGRWLEGVYESEYFPYAPSEVTQQVLDKMTALAKIEYRNYESRPENQRYHFEYRNRVLAEQLCLSSAICIDRDWAPLYRRKLGDFKIKNAEDYLDGLDVVVPLATSLSIQDFSLAEILKLRDNSKWNNAMNEFAELCYVSKTHADTAKFKEQLTLGVVQKYQEALEEERMTKRKLAVTLGKGATYTGISLIPIIGSVASIVGGKIVDPILSFLSKQNKQHNLPFFLNDMIKIKKNI